MELRLIFLCLSGLLLSSCVAFDQFDDTYEQRYKANNVVKVDELHLKELTNAPAPKVKPVVAVYGSAFLDQTGQRASNSQFALFSTAVTQDPGALLIRALKHASKGKFFRVVERGGLDNLVKERQLIRSAREQFKETSNPLQPLLFAGVLIEGSVISYETNLTTGGIGARYLGIGKSVEYREDNVTVSLRLVSVATGEILIEALTHKTVFSYGQSEDVFIFLEAGTELLEIENGNSRNESITISLMMAIEGAVLEIINIGYERSFWEHDEKIN